MALPKGKSPFLEALYQVKIDELYQPVDLLQNINFSQYSRSQLNNLQIFTQRQQDFLKLINTSAGRQLVGITENTPIIRVSPNSYHFIEKVDGDVVTVRGVFFTFEKVAKYLLKHVAYEEILEPTTFEEKYEIFLHYNNLQRFNHLPTLYLTSETYFSGSGDGVVRISGQGSWAAAHDAGTGDLATVIGTSGSVICQPQADGGWRIDRIFIPFDTAAIPDTAALISGSKVSVMLANKSGNFIELDIHLVGTTQADPTTLTTADYDAIDAVDQATAIASSTMVVDVYQEYTLNATGLASISKTGYSLFGLRTDHDFDNVACTDAGSNTTAIGFYLSEETGTSKDPKLNAEWTTTSTSTSTTSTSSSTSTTSTSTSTTSTSSSTSTSTSTTTSTSTSTTSTSTSRSTSTSTTTTTSTSTSTSTSTTSTSTSSTTSTSTSSSTSTTSTSSTTTIQYPFDVDEGGKPEPLHIYSDHGDN